MTSNYKKISIIHNHINKGTMAFDSTVADSQINVATESAPVAKNLNNCCIEQFVSTKTFQSLRLPYKSMTKHNNMTYWHSSG